MENTENRISEKIIWILTAILLSSFYIFASQTWGAYIMLATTIVILLCDAFQNEMKITWSFDSFHLNILIFIIYVFMSALWAWDGGLAIEKGITLIEVLICMSVLYVHYNNDVGFSQLLEIMMWSGYIVTGYTFMKYGFNYISSFVQSASRFEDAFANVNSIAMFISISVILTVYKTIYNKVTILLLFCIPEIYLIAATGSRKALVMTIAGLIVLLVLRFASDNIIITLFRIVILGLILYKVAPLLINLDIFSGINHRMQGLIALFTGTGKVDHSTLLRQEYVRIGLEQFKKSPIIGIGIGNARILLRRTIGSGTYLHNNYVELLACGGLIGFFLYYRIYFRPLSLYIKNLKKKEPDTIVAITLLIILLIMDYGSVSYYNKEAFFYIMLFYIHANNLIRRSFV